MGIVLDVVIVCTILISTIFGYRKGLINVVFNLCAFLLALIITIVLYTPITNFVIENTELDDKIESIIIEKGITKEVENATEGSIIDKYVSQTVTNTKNEIVESTSNIVAQKIVGIFVAIGLFIAIRVVLIFVKFLFNGIANLPIIKQFNEIGGLFYGVLRGFICAYVILAVLFLIVSINNNATIVNAINTSIISKTLYSNNLILNIIF